jgi:hypothetical protein
MDKLRLLETTFHKLSSDERFIAYYLNRYAATRQLKADEMMSQLGCSAGDYYRLGLCQAPERSHVDYTGRLARIAGYAGVPLTVLNAMMQETSLAVTAGPLFTIPLPGFLRRWYKTLLDIPAPGFALGRTSLSFLSLLFFIGVITARVDAKSQQHHKSFAEYKDSVERLCATDNTWVSSSL